MKKDWYSIIKSYKCVSVQYLGIGIGIGIFYLLSQAHTVML